MPDLNAFLGPMPPPPFARAADVVERCLHALAPPRRVSVPDWAAQERKLRTPTYTGDWDNEFAPYMVEPSRMTTSRLFSGIAFCGPARTGKSDSLILNTIGHRICCDPRDALIVCPSQDTAGLFSKRKLDPMIRTTPTVRDRQETGRGADNIHDKLFLGGMSIRIGWPVVGQFAMLEYADVVLTDYDRMPDDIGGEGSPFHLGAKRTENYGSRGKTLAESSPSRPILETGWEASTPHEAPPTTGILSLYNLGTRGQYYWTCPQCKEHFRPVFQNLGWDEKSSLGETARTAYMVCPHCGNPITPDQKHDLNKAGFWLHESNNGELVEVDDSNIRDTDIVSYWCEGPVAALQSWANLVLQYLKAREKLNSTGDETDMKTTVNVDQGRAYLSEAQINSAERLSLDALKALAERYPLEMAPSETRFLTVSVDIQSNRFVVQVDAWCEDLERYLIDRFDITQPPEDAPNGQRDADGNAKRAIDPARYLEDWAVLPPLLDKIYRVAETDYGLKPTAFIIDSKGKAGVTGKAYSFYRTMRTKGLGNRVYIANGLGGLERDRVQFRKPEKILQKKNQPTSDIRVVFVGTDKLKDEVTLSLTRKEAGGGKYHLSEHLPNRVFAELCAEERSAKGWSKKKSNIPNEALDLAVYGKALAIVIQAEKINWALPPSWAAPLENNAYAVRFSANAMEKPSSVAAPSTVKRRRVRSQGI